MLSSRYRITYPFLPLLTTKTLTFDLSTDLKALSTDQFLFEHTFIPVFVSGTSAAASNGKSLLILVSVLEPVRGSGAETTVEKFKVSFMLFYPVLVLDPLLE